MSVALGSLPWPQTAMASDGPAQLKIAKRESVTHRFDQQDTDRQGNAQTERQPDKHTETQPQTREGRPEDNDRGNLHIIEKQRQSDKYTYAQPDRREDI